MREAMFVAVAGALGALSRWGIGRAAQRVLGGDFPYGTLIANILGCFLLGLLMHISLTTDRIPPSWRLGITVGFLGALTTFSTFSYETTQLMQDGMWRMATWNIMLSLAVGLAATFAGVKIARMWVGG